MQECWINVYKNIPPYFNQKCNNRHTAIWLAKLNKDYSQCLYRIHVKVKSVKPKYEEKIIYKKGDLIDWMGF